MLYIYHVEACHIIKYHLTSSKIMSHAISCQIITLTTNTLHHIVYIMSHHVVSYPVISLSFHTVFVLHYAILYMSCHVMTCHNMPYRIMP